MAYGVTSTGFVKPTLQEIKTELESAWKDAFGNETDVSAASPDGQIIGILADRLEEIWAVAENVYLSQYPDSASGAALIDVCAITGTVPNEATNSTVTATATGTAGTVLSVGRIFQVQNSGARFVTTEAATLAALTAWATSQTWAVGDRRSANGNSYICTTGGAGATVGTGPSGTGSAISDGSAVWKYLGSGTAAADVACESEDTGPKVANAGTLNVIVTAVAGLSSVTNLLDAELGEDLETDAELRDRRAEELRLGGNSSLEAIRQDILALDDVDDAIVYENTTDSTDGSSRPPHSFECVVLGTALANDIAQVIWDGKPAGIATYGGTSGTATDSLGGSRTVNFSFATEKLAWITYAVTKKSTATMTNAEIQAAVKAAVVAWAEETGRFGLGTDLVTAKLDAAIWADEALEAQIEDVTAVTTVLKATTPSGGEYTTANKTIGANEIARFDTSRITVSVS